MNLVKIIAYEEILEEDKIMIKKYMEHVLQSEVLISYHTIDIYFDNRIEIGSFLGAFLDNNHDLVIVKDENFLIDIDKFPEFNKFLKED